MKKSALCAAALAFASLLGGCTVTHYQAPPPPAPAAAPPPAPAPPPPPAANPRPVTNITPPRPAVDMTGWQRLGERWVNAGVDRDTFLINNQTARYDSLRIKVEQSELVLYDMIVTFDDNSTFAPKMRHTFGKDAVSPPIDLPGGRRRLKKVEFRYRNVAADRRAQVELWGH